MDNSRWCTHDVGGGGYSSHQSSESSESEDVKEPVISVDQNHPVLIKSRSIDVLEIFIFRR